MLPVILNISILWISEDAAIDTSLLVIGFGNTLNVLLSFENAIVPAKINNIANIVFLNPMFELTQKVCQLNRLAAFF
jgi:hypothetical protein